MKKFLSISEVADLLSVSKDTLRRWDRDKKLVPFRDTVNGYREYKLEDLKIFPQLRFLFEDDVSKEIKPKRKFKTIEEHDEFLIDQWNKKVGANDIVYHLGDFVIGNQDESGNHVGVILVTHDI